MLEYAAGRPAIASRQSSPHAMLVVISAHVALLAVVMSAKMDLPQRIRHSPIVVNLLPEPTPPLPRPPEPQARSQPHQQQLSEVPRQIPVPPQGGVDATPSLPSFDGMIGGSTDSQPTVIPKPIPAPVKVAARLLTPPSELKPPYPASKIASGEEGAITLRLTIDERGRVVAVEPVGQPDKAFFESARRHLLAHWRYQPATEDGRPVATSFTVTLRFQLDS